MQYQFKVVPLMFSMADGPITPETAATQMQRTMDHWMSQGWEFYRMESLPVRVRAGCLATIFGRRSRTVYYPQMVFRAPYTH